MKFFNLIEYYSRLTKYRLLLISILTSGIWILMSIIGINPELKMDDQITHSNEGIFTLSCFDNKKGSRSATLEFNHRILEINLIGNSPAQCDSTQIKYLKNFTLIENKTVFSKNFYLLEAEEFGWKDSKRTTFKSIQSIQEINSNLKDLNQFIFIVTIFLWFLGFVMLFSTSKNFSEFKP